MNKPIKYLLIGVSLLIVLVVAATIAASILINPNDYKNDIVSAVKNETGRDLNLKGDIKLSLFPWLGLGLGETHFSNAPGFDRKPMASINAVEVQLKLLPLLRKEVEIKTIILDGLDLNLACNRLGRCNWDDLASTGKPTSTTKATGKSTTAAAAPVAALTIGGIDIRNAQVHWVDASSGGDTHIRNLSLKTSKLAARTPMNLKLGFDLQTGKPVIRTPVSLSGQVTVDPDKETLKVKQLQLSLLDLNIVMNVNGSNMIKAPQINGQLTLKPANLRKVLNQLGMPVDMQANALQNVALNSKFNFSKKSNTVSISKLTLNLDDSTLTGKAAVGLGVTPVIQATIAIDQIDADRYLAQTTQSGKATKTSGNAKAAPAPVVIPVEPLRTLNLQGKFSLGSLKLMGIRSTKIVIPINTHGGLVKIGPSHAQLYGGSYRGEQVLDVRKGAPRIQLNEKLTNVQIGGLLKDAGIFDKFTGVGNVSGKVTARGLDLDDVLNTLTGTANASLKNGRIKGLNLHKMVNDARQAYAKAQGQPVKTSAKVTDEMEYAKLTASATIHNGVVTNKDLNMDGPFTRVTGNGTVNLPKSNVDYRAKVLISENKSDPPVPVRINGPFSNLSFSIEWDKILQDRARKEVDKRIEQERKNAEERLKKELGDKLQNLFKR